MACVRMHVLYVCAQEQSLNQAKIAATMWKRVADQKMEGIKTHTHMLTQTLRDTRHAHNHISQAPGIIGYIWCNQRETKTAVGL